MYIYSHMLIIKLLMTLWELFIYLTELINASNFIILSLILKLFIQISSDHSLCEDTDYEIPLPDSSSSSEVTNMPSSSAGFEDTDFPISTENQDDKSLFSKLWIWALKFQIKQNATSDLLKLLQLYHPELPADARTLLKTSRDAKIIKRKDNEYCYFSISSYLQKIDLKKVCPDKKILMRINIDGLPVCKSTRAQFLSLLGLIESKVEVSPFVIACH